MFQNSIIKGSTMLHLTMIRKAIRLSEPHHWPRIHTPSGIWIGSAVLHGTRSLPTDIQTTLLSGGSKRPHCHAMRPKCSPYYTSDFPKPKSTRDDRKLINHWIIQHGFALNQLLTISDFRPLLVLLGMYGFAVVVFPLFLLFPALD